MISFSPDSNNLNPLQIAIANKNPQIIKSLIIFMAYEMQNIVLSYNEEILNQTYLSYLLEEKHEYIVELIVSRVLSPQLLNNSKMSLPLDYPYNLAMI